MAHSSSSWPLCQFSYIGPWLQRSGFIAPRICRCNCGAVRSVLRNLESEFPRRSENRFYHFHHQRLQQRRRMATIAAPAGQDSSKNGAFPERSTRKVVEHVVLFQMKDDLTEEQEKDMLDHLYSLQYQLKGIIAISLGRVLGRAPEGVTHALFERFSSKELLEQYMQHPTRWKVANELIIPYYSGLIMVDFEAEVEDDIEQLFRRGDGFQQGIEHLVLLKLKEGASEAAVNRMLQAFNGLSQELGSSILVQLTTGTNFSRLNRGYTHGVVARLPSEEALDAFSKHPAYVKVFTENVLPISAGILSADYYINPVGTTAL